MLYFMKKIYLVLILASFIAFQSCALVTTREEVDTYTISKSDTTFTHFVKNAAANKDRGVISPSTKVIESNREVSTFDSVLKRYYPDFIRVGLLETVGILGGDSKSALGFGLFGIHPDLGSFDQSFRGDTAQSHLITGGIYRLGIIEHRWRVFGDDPNWTWGINAFEMISGDAKLENALMAYGTPYMRKRFFLRDDIPYLAVTAAIGVGFYPSRYVNASVSLDLGSIAGLNLRAYVGYAVGSNSTDSPQIEGNDFAPTADPLNPKSPKVATSPSIPYAGIGISFLDFLNLVPETYTEWKDHQHSGWEIGFLQVGLLGSGSKYSVVSSLKDTISAGFFKGATLKLINTSVAIPYFDNKFYVGTSLINILAMGRSEWGMGILPIRLGYFYTLVADELTTEPFLEYNYTPSSFFNIGNRINLRLSDRQSINFIIGYASGSSGLEKLKGGFLVEQLGLSTSFSNYYFGISMSLWDNIFLPAQLRYNKK
jgi:hypothetical protein